MPTTRTSNPTWPHAAFLCGALFLTLADQANAQRVHGGTAQSVHAGRVDRGANINRDRDINRNVNRNVNRDVHRDIDIDVDVDHDWDGGWRDHPIATGVAIGATAAVTSAVVGSMLYSLPPACSPRGYGGLNYYYCGGVWYEPRYYGTSVTYVVINPPG